MRTQLKTFLYNCQCGHEVKVFCDSGLPQEYYKCRHCGNKIKRKEL